MSEWKPTSIHDALGNKKPSGKIPFWRIFAVVTLIALCFFGYFNAQRNRYRPFADGDLILDTWTGNVYELETKIINNQKTE